MSEDNKDHDLTRGDSESSISGRDGVGRRVFLLSTGVVAGSAAGCTGMGEEQDTQEPTSTDEPEEDNSTQGEADNRGEESEGDDSTESAEDENDPEESEQSEEETEYADMRVYAMDEETTEYLTGAHVTLESSETGETYSLTTEEGQEFNGNYARFQNLPLGLYYVTITADGYKEATNTIQLVESGRQPILHMVPTSTQTADMRVYAEHSRTSEYLSSVDVTIENQETGTRQTMITTEGQEFDGTYARFKNLSLGTYEITARLPDFEPAHQVVELGESGRQPILEMNPSGPEEDDRYTITVRLIDADTGEGISGGTVSMWPNRLGYGPGPDATDNNGEVRFEHLEHYGFDHDPELEISGLQARAAGYSSVRQSLSWRPSESPTELTVTMEPDESGVDRGVLTVNAVAADTGDPLKIVTVYIEQGGESVITERTDRLGTAQFSLEDGLEYTVSALGEGGVYESDTRTVVLNGNTEITLSMERI